MSSSDTSDAFSLPYESNVSQRRLDRLLGLQFATLQATQIAFSNNVADKLGEEDALDFGQINTPAIPDENERNSPVEEAAPPVPSTVHGEQFDRPSLDALEFRPSRLIRRPDSNQSSHELSSSAPTPLNFRLKRKTAPLPHQDLYVPQNVLADLESENGIEDRNYGSMHQRNMVDSTQADHQAQNQEHNDDNNDDNDYNGNGDNFAAAGEEYFPSSNGNLSGHGGLNPLPSTPLQNTGDLQNGRSVSPGPQALGPGYDGTQHLPIPQPPSVPSIKRQKREDDEPLSPVEYCVDPEELSHVDYHEEKPIDGEILDSSDEEESHTMADIVDFVADPENFIAVDKDSIFRKEEAEEASGTDDESEDELYKPEEIGEGEEDLIVPDLDLDENGFDRQGGSTRDASGRRVSRRKRVPPVAWWRGESVEYTMDSLLLPTLKEVIAVVLPERQRRQYRIRDPKIQGSANEDRAVGDQGPRSIGLGINPGPDTRLGRELGYTDDGLRQASGPETIGTQGSVNANVFCDATKEFESLTVAQAFQDMELTPHRKYPKIKTAPILRLATDAPLQTLIMDIERGGVFPLHNSRNRFYIFWILTGILSVTVNDKTFDVRRGTAIQVPGGNDFSLENVGTSTARMIILQNSDIQHAHLADPTGDESIFDETRNVTAASDNGAGFDNASPGFDTPQNYSQRLNSVNLSARQERSPKAKSSTASNTNAKNDETSPLKSSPPAAPARLSRSQSPAPARPEPEKSDRPEQPSDQISDESEEQFSEIRPLPETALAARREQTEEPISMIQFGPSRQYDLNSPPEQFSAIPSAGPIRQFRLASASEQFSETPLAPSRQNDPTSPSEQFSAIPSNPLRPYHLASGLGNLQETPLRSAHPNDRVSPAEQFSAMPSSPLRQYHLASISEQYTESSPQRRNFPKWTPMNRLDRVVLPSREFAFRPDAPKPAVSAPVPNSFTRQQRSQKPIPPGRQSPVSDEVSETTASPSPNQSESFEPLPSHSIYTIDFEESFSHRERRTSISKIARPRLPPAHLYSRQLAQLRRQDT